ncbi:hypothetical protein EDC96DRAFT_520491 [Choanephora cucurbitarum]|nr:hypothetical protein EDC96DRAFT_520491 [Choanephora cucurbitarum]
MYDTILSIKLCLSFSFVYLTSAFIMLSQTSFRIHGSINKLFIVSFCIPCILLAYCSIQLKKNTTHPQDML